MKWLRKPNTARVLNRLSALKLHQVRSNVRIQLSELTEGKISNEIMDVSFSRSTFVIFATLLIDVKFLPAWNSELVQPR